MVCCQTTVTSEEPWTTRRRPLRPLMTTKLRGVHASAIGARDHGARRIHRSSSLYNRYFDASLPSNLEDSTPKEKRENQWPTLVAFLKHPEVEIDNNAAERAIRQMALGRKNYMFAGSAKGGHAAAVLCFEEKI